MSINVSGLNANFLRDVFGSSAGFLQQPLKFHTKTGRRGNRLRREIDANFWEVWNRNKYWGPRVHLKWSCDFGEAP